MRQCRKCDQPATNAKGPATCDTCRAPHVRQPSRPLATKRCKTCTAEYRTRGTDPRCSSCINASRKHPCERCGTPCDHRAVHCRACATETAPSGADTPTWRGGRTVNALTGYVRVKAYDHPRARKSSGFYVLEHVLVMEAHLGRYLLPGETVHHRNGARADNRLENLELWATSQPAGQRVVDLLAWAHDIIGQYEGTPVQ